MSELHLAFATLSEVGARNSDILPSPPSPASSSVTLDDDDATGSALLPDQPPSTQRQIRLFDADEGYDFLPRPLQLIVDASPGCGGVTWPAALVLARYLAYRIKRDPLPWSNALSVVELGAGTGILSLALASLLQSAQVDRSQKPKVWATDLDFLCPLMEANVALNELEASVSVSPLPWGLPLPAPIPVRPDIVLAADCVYFEPTFPQLVDTLCRLTGPSDGPSARPTQEVLFCYQKRRKADKRFFNLLKRHFTWEIVRDDPYQTLYDRRPMYLYRLHRKACPQ